MNIKDYYVAHFKLLQKAITVVQEGKVYTDLQNGTYDMLLKLDLAKVDKSLKMKYFDEARMNAIREAGLIGNDPERRRKLLEMADDRNNQGNNFHPDLIPRVKALIFQYVLEREVKDGPDNVKMFLNVVEDKINSLFQ